MINCTPKLGGQFELESGGQFAPKLVVNLHWNRMVNLTGFSIKGAQYPAISDKDLLSIKIPLPNSIKEQEKIVSTIKLITDTTNNFINEIQIKLDNMKALKSSLLDQAFKGEL